MADTIISFARDAMLVLGHYWCVICHLIRFYHSLLITFFFTAGLRGVLLLPSFRRLAQSPCGAVSMVTSILLGYATLRGAAFQCGGNRGIRVASSWLPQDFFGGALLVRYLFLFIYQLIRFYHTISLLLSF